MIDYTVNIVQIIQIVVLVIGGFVTIGGGLIGFGMFRKTFEHMTGKITGMETELKKLSEVIVTLAVATKRLDNIEEDIRDMKHGRGFIRIEGEYPP